MIGSFLTWKCLMYKVGISFLHSAVVRWSETYCNCRRFNSDFSSLSCTHIASTKATKNFIFCIEKYFLETLYVVYVRGTCVVCILIFPQISCGYFPILKIWAIVDSKLNTSEKSSRATMTQRFWLPQITCVISNRGTWGKCKGDKKHCCFHWELNYGLNSGLKQRYYVYWTISNFRIIPFHSFSFFSKFRFPYIPRFDITQVKWLKD